MGQRKNAAKNSRVKRKTARAKPCDMAAMWPERPAKDKAEKSGGPDFHPARDRGTTPRLD